MSEFDNLIERVKHWRINRRSFLINSVLVLGSWVYSACTKNPVKPKEEEIIIDPDPDSDPVYLIAKINGTREARLPETGDVEVSLSGEKSKGAVKSYDWGKKGPSDSEFTSLGQDGNSLIDNIAEPGITDYRLIVKDNKNNASEAQHETLVFASTDPYNNPIAFFHYKDRVKSLYFMDPYTWENKREIPLDGWVGSALSWEPDGRRIVLTKKMDDTYGWKKDLHTYDVETGALEHLLATEGISRNASWNPKKNWIAFVEDSRHITNGIDELVLINPDTKEVNWLSGDTWKDEFIGDYPSWDPEGERIALGAARFYTSDRRVGRIAIYSNLFGSPKRKRLHTEGYLLSVGVFGDIKYLREGINGVAWSPDGELIAYNAMWSLDSETQNRIIIAKADGSGIIKILPNEMAYNPSWSPGGQYLLFNAWKKDAGHIYIANREGEDVRDLSPDASAAANDSFPKWYG